MNVWLGPSHHRHAEQRPLTLSFFLAALLLAAALVFGGASRQHAVPLAVVELISLPLLFWSLWQLAANRAWREIKTPLILLFLVILVPLVQLIPLPASVWRSLPGRESIAAALTIAGQADGARPFTLAPHETWKAALALLPPAAMFLAAVRLGSRERRLLLLVLLVATLINLGIGVAQTVGAQALYAYANTNVGAAVGLFSNRNHYSVLLVISLPLAALWLKGWDVRHGQERLASILAGLLIVVLVIVGVIMGRSRAGVGLLLPALALSGYLILRTDRGVRIGRTGLIVLGIVVAVFIATLVFGLKPLLDRFGDNVFADVRFAAAPEIMRQAIAHLPLGSGIGSFEQVYQSEEPVKLIMPEFLNHAHDDFLELWLEAGVAALGLFAAFAIWWVRRVLRAVKLAGPYPDLAVAGAAVSGILLLHSVVDYPLRTPALATVFAFACGLLATPEPIGRRREAKARAEPEARVAKRGPGT